jgi:hypothetical protein
VPILVGRLEATAGERARLTTMSASPRARRAIRVPACWSDNCRYFDATHSCQALFLEVPGELGLAPIRASACAALPHPFGPAELMAVVAQRGARETTTEVDRKAARFALAREESGRAMGARSTCWEFRTRKDWRQLAGTPSVDACKPQCRLILTACVRNGRVAAGGRDWIGTVLVSHGSPEPDLDP